MLTKGHYYHSIIRKTVAIFGTMFNDINVLRRGGGGVESIIKVPLSYGPKQKFLARLDQQSDLEDQKLAIKLPRMSFEMTGMAYDSTTKQSMFNRLQANPDVGDTKAFVSNSVPYILDFQLNIMVKNQDDGLQIVEQILPLFQPTYNVSVRYLEGVENSFDVPITLQNVSFVDDYEGDYESRRVIIYTLDFQLKTRFWGPVDTSAVIRQVYTNFVDLDDTELFEMVQVQTDPVYARQDDTWNTQTAVYFIPTVFRFQLQFISGEILGFQEGESILGQTSGTTAIIQSVIYDEADGQTKVQVSNPDAYFIEGENILGNVSGTQAQMFDYEILT